MLFESTGMPPAVIVDLEPHVDERGLFARSWCRREFEAYGLNSSLVQCSISHNRVKGTLRGLHKKRMKKKYREGTKMK